MTIESVRRSFEQDLLRLPNVVSVGIGEKGGRQIIQVGVTKKVPASQLRPDEVVPGSLQGYEVEVVQIGHPAAEVKGEHHED
jgi:hypothetical protein